MQRRLNAGWRLPHPLVPAAQVPAASDVIKRTVKIEASTVEIEERGVKLRLTVVGKAITFFN